MKGWREGEKSRDKEGDEVSRKTVSSPESPELPGPQRHEESEAQTERLMGFRPRVAASVAPVLPVRVKGGGLSGESRLAARPGDDDAARRTDRPESSPKEVVHVVGEITHKLDKPRL
ncbi:hypothetical protein EYF80_022889 [Liparis tanakae]|uniref:Uncharacterized protein n=1 Tax=Liparis tanakae TaxID=230148 RepID=A0A4Z2HMM5_9TELE|nr:hypothetical protein EYF80_022889 [Liparis tanakae]